MHPLRLIPLVLATVAAGAPSDATPRLEVLRSDETVLEVRWTWDEPRMRDVPGAEAVFRRPEVDGALYLAEPGRPDLPTVVRLVGIPEGPMPRVSVVSVAASTLPLPDLAPAPEPVIEGAGRSARGAEVVRARDFPAGATPGIWAELLGEAWVRGRRAARLAIHPCRYHGARGTLEWARELVVRVEFPPARGPSAGTPRVDWPEWESTFDETILNADAARAWRRPRGEQGAAPRGGGPSFDSAPRWIRVPISATAVYRLDYYTFANIGVDPGTIDPTTIRVFAGNNLPLPENLLLSPPADFMTECALQDLGDGDGVFDASDVFLLYALGPNGWASEYDSTRSRTEYVENKHNSRTWYWITWGGDFPAPPKRMATRSVPDNTATEWPDSAPHRLHFERNNLENFNFRDEDGWMWEDLRGRGNDRRYDLDVESPASGSGFLTGRLYSHGATDTLRARGVELKVRGVTTTRWTWTHSTVTATQDVTGCFEGLLVPGPNAVLVDAKLDDRPDIIELLYTAWFDLEYDRRLVARNGWLKFFSDPNPPVLPQPPSGTGCDSLPPAELVYGTRAHRLMSFDAPGAQIHFFDVTNQHEPVRLVDWTRQNASPPHNIRFSDPTVTGNRWYVAATMSAVKPLPTGRIASVRGLRSVANGTEYLVIHHGDFRAGAARLAALRDARWGRAASMVVDVEDVYQEFGWGMKDPVAIRNFLVYAQERWANGAPLYVALVGDASFDTKPYLPGSPRDFMPSYTERYRENSLQYVTTDNVDFYSTDDFFGYLDPGDYAPGVQPTLDVAIGRFPVATSAALGVMLDKLASYYAYRMPGHWQNRILLVADDERTLNPAVREAYHTQQVEAVAVQRVPPAMDKVKVYLVNYPRDAFGKKPTAQAAFIDEFTRGALMTSYTGHGDQSTLAQEEVFVTQKTSQVLNEERYTVFSTFSCTVSRFDLISGSSMAELLLVHEDGGPLTTFASGGLVFPTPSYNLHLEWLGAMFGTPYPIWTYTRDPRPLGLAALTAKNTLATNGGLRKNSEKYVTLGDPALEVRFGRHLVEFDAPTVSQLETDGLLRRITGRVVNSTGQVLDGGAGGPAFHGTAYVHVTENADTSGYDYTTDAGLPQHIDFVMEGPTAYRGRIPVVGGRFEAKFYLNEGVRPGNKARVSVFALEDGGRDASGAYDSLVIAPTISPSQVDDTEGPRIVIRFEGYDRFVDGDQIFTEKPVLLISLEDPSGINLRPFPQFARLEAEVDRRDRIDLVGDFTYEGGFTSGTVRRILPLAAGEHNVQVKAFDNVGNRSVAGVRFTIVLPGSDFDLVDRNVAVYPNPFRHRADFLYRLTHDADVRLSVFTITGRRIRELRVAGTRGENVLSWDGTDERGTPLANGTYLYKLEAERLDDDGNLESDEFVGKVVRMR